MNPKQWPATIHEAVGVVIATLSDDDKARIAATSKPDLIGLHFGLGTWVRNNLGLWNGNDDLLQAIREHDSSIHPDDASIMIVEAVWQRLREALPKVH